MGTDAMMTTTEKTDAQPQLPGAAPMQGGGTWFAVQTYSSFERKVKEGIEHRAALEGMRNHIRQVLIPTETVVEIKGGKKRSVQRALMPGYVLVEMDPSEEAFNLIKEVKGVASFVGDGHTPTPLAPDEVENLINIMEDKHEKPKPKMLYRKGDQIKVVEGPFVNFVGNVEEVDEGKGKLRVMVSIFGRPTPVELDVLQVESA
jgi:transcriptional antiterminator NusG